MDDNTKSAKPFFSIFSANTDLIKETMDKISKVYGEIDWESDFLNFDQTTYYEKEFGKNLKRKIFTIKTLINPINAIEIKLSSMKMEDDLRLDGKRIINIDPGYIELSRVILTTRKPYSHRIYIGKGIYADLTLIFKRGEGYLPLPWTYPDYASEQYRSFFNDLRKVLKMNLKGELNCL